MEHKYYKREDGLKHCERCNGAEGGLPTDCPGVRMDMLVEEAVMAGKIDFINNRWRFKNANETKS